MSEDKKIFNIEEVIQKQQTDLANGLSEEEVKKRIQQFGLNEIPENQESVIHRIFRRLWGPIPWMIEVAAILSAVAQKWEDFIIIMVLLVVNVVVDFAQESKALNVLKVLKEKLAKKALVKRDGAYKSIESKFVVPGDIIKLKIGDIVPADAVAAKGSYVQVDQAALTGESLPVNKTAGEEIFGNSIVKMGEMDAIVTATAMNTFFGKSAALVYESKHGSKKPFSKSCNKIWEKRITITKIFANTKSSA